MTHSKKEENDYFSQNMREKVYFREGDLVTLKHDMPNKPIMCVESVDKATLKFDGNPKLLGITCFWFSENGLLQRNRFNTKDLEHVEQ